MFVKQKVKKYSPGWMDTKELLKTACSDQHFMHKKPKFKIDFYVHLIFSFLSNYVLAKSKMKKIVKKFVSIVFLTFISSAWNNIVVSNFSDLCDVKPLSQGS